MKGSLSGFNDREREVASINNPFPNSALQEVNVGPSMEKGVS
jgi:hypothetical protein